MIIICNVYYSDRVAFVVRGKPQHTTTAIAMISSCYSF